MFSIFQSFNLEVVGLAVKLGVVGLVGAGWGGRGRCNGWSGWGQKSSSRDYQYNNKTMGRFLFICATI